VSLSLESLQYDAVAYLNHYVQVVPEALGRLVPGQRQHLYKILRLRVIAEPEGSVEVNGAFGEGLHVCGTKTMSRPLFISLPTMRIARP
jgi:hypothetical protein